MDKYKLDPTNDFETVKEYTKEELYEQYFEENKVPDVIHNYIEELESNNLKMRKGIKSLIEIYSTLEDKEPYINLLKQLL